MDQADIKDGGANWEFEGPAEGLTAEDALGNWEGFSSQSASPEAASCSEDGLCASADPT